MTKIVLVGAGSRHFGRNFITDVVMYPELRDSTITLVDIDKERLDLTTAFAKKLVEQHGFKTQIQSTTDRREALEGADYVITSLAVGEGKLNGQTITTKYGLPWDDTTGPCGVFYGSRHIQAILEVCHDMEKLCPNAWLFNYTNPEGMICWAINDYTRIKNVGLCPNQHNLAAHLASWVGIPFDEVSYWLAGINHFSWYLEFKWRGEDAYPLLREKFKDPGVYSGPDVGVRYDDALGSLVGVDLLEVEMFKTFGYFTNGGGGHISRYVPYFMKTPELIKRYNVDDFLLWAERHAKMREEEEKEFKRQISSDYKFPIINEYRWSVFAANIIHSIETGTPRRINCNVKNNGLITNLLKGCCVEVPCLVDKEGIHPCYVGDLPPQCAALIQPIVHVQQLAVRGIVEKDKTKIVQSILLDPLTSAILTIDETKQMVDELFKSEQKYLKGFK